MTIKINSNAGIIHKVNDSKLFDCETFKKLTTNYDASLCSRIVQLTDISNAFNALVSALNEMEAAKSTRQYYRRHGPGQFGPARIIKSMEHEKENKGCLWCAHGKNKVLYEQNGELFKEPLNKNSSEAFPGYARLKLNKNGLCELNIYTSQKGQSRWLSRIDINLRTLKAGRW